MELNNVETLAQDILTKNNLDDVIVSQRHFNEIDDKFSTNVSNEMNPTDQGATGRCWMFAGLNTLRNSFSKKYNLDNEFEFSQNHLFYYDKLERCNYFFDLMIELSGNDFNDRKLSFLLQNPLVDGGQWNMFQNLVNKYGIIPKSIFKTNFSSENSRKLNMILKTKLREGALELRKNANPAKKIKLLCNIEKILQMFLGKPPSKFSWEYKNRNGTKFSCDNIKPTAFYEQFVNQNINDKVCLINDPRNAYNQLYTVEYLNNISGLPNPVYLNLDMVTIENLAIKSLKNNMPVWFGCDVGKFSNHKDALMSVDCYNPSKLLNQNMFSLNKKERLLTGESLMTHAMTFTGVDIQKKKTKKWRVENSWGNKGKNKGYWTMDQKWFNEFVYEVVIDSKFLAKSHSEVLKNKRVNVLPAWDPMGSLARQKNSTMCQAYKLKQLPQKALSKTIHAKPNTFIHAF